MMMATYTAYQLYCIRFINFKTTSSVLYFLTLSIAEKQNVTIKIERFFHEIRQAVTTYCCIISF
jgi:hypothetical protein